MFYEPFSTKQTGVLKNAQARNFLKSQKTNKFRLPSDLQPKSTLTYTQTDKTNKGLCEIKSCPARLQTASARRTIVCQNNDHELIGRETIAEILVDFGGFRGVTHVFSLLATVFPQLLLY